LTSSLCVVEARTPEENDVESEVRSMRRLMSLCIGIAATLAATAPAHAQIEQPTAPPLPERAIETGRSYEERSEAGVQNVMRIDTTAPFSLVQATITRTNARCEVWGRLIDVDGTTLGRAFVFGNASGTITGLVATAGPVVLVVDDGPYVSCGGATYTVTVQVTGVDPTPEAGSQSTGPTSTIAQRSPNVTACLCWANRAEQLSTKIRRLNRQLSSSRGSTRRRLERRRIGLRRSYTSARAQARRWCR
jgi:hypothetical protein